MSLGRTSMLGAAMLVALSGASASVEVPFGVFELTARRRRRTTRFYPIGRSLGTKGANRNPRQIERDRACYLAWRMGELQGRTGGDLDTSHFNNVQEQDAFLQGLQHGREAKRQARSDQ